MFDARDFDWYRGKTIVDSDMTEYTVDGSVLVKKPLSVEEDQPTERHDVVLLCAMPKVRIQEMVEAVRALGTQDKEATHNKMVDYITADDHASAPAPGLKLIGLYKKVVYCGADHQWKHPAVLSKDITEVRLP